VFTLYNRLYNQLYDHYRLYNRLGVNYANEPSQAALERSSQDAYDAQQGGCVDSRRGAFDRFLENNSYVLILTSVACDPEE